MLGLFRLATPDDSLLIVRMMFPRLDLPSCMRKINMNLRRRPSNGVGNEKNKPFRISQERKFTKLTQLFQLGIPGPASDGCLSPS